MLSKIIKILLGLTAIISIFCLITPALAANETLIKNVIIDEAGRIIMIETEKDQTLPKPEVSRLVGPNRLVIDVPAAI